MTETTTANWRDITGLTAEQTNQLTAGANLMTEDELIELALQMAAQNHLQASLTHIPVPAGAVTVSAWYDDGETCTREVYGTAWNVGNVNARITGEQSSSGVTAWRVEVDPVERTIGDLTAAQAREMAAAMLQAADELDRLTEESPPFM
jgi:hypothetical protein